MSGLDSDILREKIKQKMPKPPNFSFGLKAFLAIAIISLILLGLVGGSFIAVIPAGHVGVLDRFGVVSDTVLSPGFNFKDHINQRPRDEYSNPAKRIQRSNWDADE